MEIQSKFWSGFWIACWEYAKNRGIATPTMIDIEELDEYWSSMGQHSKTLYNELALYRNRYASTLPESQYKKWSGFWVASWEYAMNVGAAHPKEINKYVLDMHYYSLSPYTRQTYKNLAYYRTKSRA